MRSLFAHCLVLPYRAAQALPTEQCDAPCVNDGGDGNSGSGRERMVSSSPRVVKYSVSHNTDKAFLAPVVPLPRLTPAPLHAPTAPPPCVPLQGQWTEDLGCWLVTADEEGGMAVWEGLATDGYRLLLAIPPTGEAAGVGHRGWSAYHDVP